MKRENEPDWIHLAKQELSLVLAIGAFAILFTLTLGVP